MHFLEQKQLIIYLIGKYGLEFDTNVYSINQQFRTLNQSKLILSKVKFITLFDKDIDMNKILINMTITDKKIKFIKSNSIIYNDLNVSNKTPLLIDTVDIINMLINNEIEIDNSLYNNNLDWKYITNIIIKMITDKELLLKWSHVSVTRANNNDYTEEKNNKFIEKQKQHQIKSGFPKLYQILNKYSKYFLTYISYFLPEHTINNLSKIFNKDIVKKATDIIYSNDKKKTTVTLTNIEDKECELNIKTGFITLSNHIISNIYYDNQPIQQESLFTELNNIEDAVEHINDFITNTKKCMVLKSRWGTGKTHKCINKLISAFDNQYRIVIITESNTLNGKLLKDFENLNFQSHLNCSKSTGKILTDSNNMICSIQSIQKLDRLRFNEMGLLLIIDEFESVLNSYSACSTFKSAHTTPVEAYDRLLDLIKLADKSFICDADISEDKLGLIIPLFKKREIICFKNNELAFSNYKFNIYQKSMMNQIINDFKNGLKLIIPCATKTPIKRIEGELKLIMLEGEYKSKKILKIDQEGVKLYQNLEGNIVSLEYEKIETLNNIEKFIIDNKVDIFLYSPTVKTGVSINAEYFHKCYGFSSNKSIIFTEFLQQLFRARNLKLKEINICLDIWCSYKKNRPLYSVENMLLCDIKQFNSLVNRLDSQDFELYTDNKPYFKLQTINNMNLLNSTCNYTQNFLQLLQYHKLNYNYIAPEITILTAVDAERKRINEYIQIPLMNHYNYLELKQNDSIPLTDQPSYRKTNFLYLLWNIHNRLKQLKYVHVNDDLIYILLGIELDKKKEQIISNKKDRDKLTLELKNIKSKQNTYFQTHNESISILIQEIMNYHNNNTYEFYKLYEHALNQILHIRNTMQPKYFSLSLTPNDKSNMNAHYTHQIMFNILQYDFKPLIITNKQLKSLFQQHADILNEAYKYLNNYGAVKEFDLKFSNEEHCKKMYLLIKSLLNEIDIKMKYFDKTHTTGNNDKIQFYNNENIYIYKKKLIEKSKTLEHFKNDSKIVCYQNIQNITDKETTKYIKMIKKITNTNKLEVQKALLGKDYDNRRFYSNKLLNMEITNDKVKVGKNNLYINQKIDNKSVKTNVYKVGTVYRPYKPNQPIIKTNRNIIKYDKSKCFNKLDFCIDCDTCFIPDKPTLPDYKKDINSKLTQSQLIRYPTHTKNTTILDKYQIETNELVLLNTMDKIKQENRLIPILKKLKMNIDNLKYIDLVQIVKYYSN